MLHAEIPLWYSFSGCRQPSLVHIFPIHAHLQVPPVEISAFLLLVHLVPPLSYHGHPEQGAQVLWETSKEGEKGSGMRHAESVPTLLHLIAPRSSSRPFPT